MLYYRLAPILEKHQADDQFGFRRDKRIDDVFIILENLMGETDEWNLPLWMISLDLRKAFDRVKFGPLFVALRDQEVPEAYIQLLSALYEKQQGCVDGSRKFPIERGVKQGDVLSSMLFQRSFRVSISRMENKIAHSWFLIT